MKMDKSNVNRAKSVLTEIVQHSIDAASYELLFKVFTELERMDKELDIVHKCLTELYNYPDNKIGDRIKECLDKIGKL